MSKPGGSLTNHEFASTDLLFYECCRLAGIDPTPRQASKYRNQCGAAYAHREQAIRKIEQAIREIAK